MIIKLSTSPLKCFGGTTPSKFCSKFQNTSFNKLRAKVMQEARILRKSSQTPNNDHFIKEVYADLKSLREQQLKVMPSQKKTCQNLTNKPRYLAHTTSSAAKAQNRYNQLIRKPSDTKTPLKTLGKDVVRKSNDQVINMYKILAKQQF